ncbi:MAG TPA: LeuA family protein, partial [Polyangiaceae bacterium]
MASRADLETAELIHDWNQNGARDRVTPEVELLDETLRDGLQNPSVRMPTVPEKVRILELMHQIGVNYAVLGLPSISQRSFQECLRLCKEVQAKNLGLNLVVSGRTLVSDVEPIIDLSQRAGMKLTAYLFVGTSPIRALAEDWDLEQIRRYSVQAIELAVRGGLSTTYVAEDASRARPEVLADLFRLAVEHGASRICLCDTVGHVTPDGVRNLVQFTRDVVQGTNPSIGIDWHGHNDRGMALINTLTALEAGANRAHTTALGIGERAGNCPTELVLLNWKLAGSLGGRDLSELLEYCRVVAAVTGWQIPVNYPLVGRDAFRTATGVHASAIIKAEAKGRAWLADRVYSSVPAGSFGRNQEICVGYMS